jgi:hypothetical protein
MSGDATTRATIPADPPPGGEREMMSQAEIVAFLTARGIEPLRGWRPGEPLLYVIEDSYRTDTAHYGDLPKRLRPSVARLDNPDSLDSSDRAVDKDGRWSRIFRIVNQSGGQVDYYAIDPDSHEVSFVRSSPSKRDQDYPYVAPEGLLFRAGDTLFPKA